MGTRFWNLSPELRNYVYELVVKEASTIDVTSPEQIAVGQPALTRTCRQIRSESLPLYYGINHFLLDKYCYNANYGSHRTRPCADHSLDFASYVDMYWTHAIGYDNLRHTNRLTIQSDAYGGRKSDVVSFIVRLHQDRPSGTLKAIEGYIEYGTTFGLGITGSTELHSKSSKALDKLLAKLMRRKTEPGLSAEGIQAIVACLTNPGGRGCGMRRT
ncbi:hypothetical protein LTR08_004762 [Meristemomyces frigidus]|nr:hypothetical protein LTR08_004762 [Meristemomyces frigidus]